MGLNDGLIANGLKFAADGMIHAVQPVAQRKKQRALHHEDSSDDPTVCLTCECEECDGSARCYQKRKKQLEENKK